MAVDSMNDSYNRCLAELRERYRGRGVAQNAKNEFVSQVQKEDTSYLASSGNYVLYDSRSKIADCYRSGEYNGSKYMTSDDFVRYFKSRRDFYMPSALREREAEASKNSAVPKRQHASAGRGLVRSDSDSKEGHLSNVTARIKAFCEKWFPMEPREGRAEGARFQIPVSVLSGVAVFTLSLGLIVGGSVMIGSASGELGQQRSEIARLEAEQMDLSGKLDLKYNLNDIEEDAKSLGMIKRHYATQEYLTVNDEEEIILHEDEDEQEKKEGFVALLSSFGIEIDG